MDHPARRAQPIEWSRFIISASLLLALGNFLYASAQFLLTNAVRVATPPPIYPRHLTFISQTILLVLLLRWGIAPSALGLGKGWGRIRQLQSVTVLLTGALFLLEAGGLEEAGLDAPLGGSFWLAAFIVGVVGTLVWFLFQLRKTKTQLLYPLGFLMLTLALISLPFYFGVTLALTEFRVSVPVIFSIIGGWVAPPLLMVTAAFIFWMALALREGESGKGRSLAVSLGLLLIAGAFLLPVFLEGYEKDLINWAVRGIGFYGLGYVGLGSITVSLQFAAFAVYSLLLMAIRRDSVLKAHPAAQRLVLLGVASFPWGGVTLSFLGYSSIPGNLIALDAVILGFFLVRRPSNKGML